jgi:hypothetical protein
MEKKICELKLNEMQSVTGGVAEYALVMSMVTMPALPKMTLTLPKIG